MSVDVSRLYCRNPFTMNFNPVTFPVNFAAYTNLKIIGPNNKPIDNIHKYEQENHLIPGSIRPLITNHLLRRSLTHDKDALLRILDIKKTLDSFNIHVVSGEGNMGLITAKEYDYFIKNGDAQLRNNQTPSGLTTVELTKNNQGVLEVSNMSFNA